jgi:steroid delta-isomerase-like uncharacterized protein
VSRRLERDRRGLAISLAAAAVAGGALTAGVRRRRRPRSGLATEAELRVRRVLEEPWKGNWGVLDDLVGADYLGWSSGQPDPITGREGLRERLRAYADAFPDARLAVQDQVAAEDRVATRWTARGTHAGDLAELQATGKEVTVSGLTISRLEGGKVVEQWTTWDRLGMLVQVGAIPAPAEA